MSIEDPFAVIGRHLFPAGGRQPVSCYVALGDSFTAGTGTADGERWPDRLAAGLRAANVDLAYRNLASEGATSAEVSSQVGPAIQLEPDLVTVVCGANDVLRRVRPDVRGYGVRFSRILARLQAALPEVAILTATSPESWRFLELGPRTRARVVAGLRDLNATTRAVAEQHGVPCLDVVDHPGLEDPSNFSGDGLHPSAAGHERAAREFARCLLDEFGIRCDLTGRTR
jgi:lysophospholipase L1-like esterase